MCPAPWNPHYGGYPLRQAESFRCAKSGVLGCGPARPHWGPECTKIITAAFPPLRLGFPSQRARSVFRRRGGTPGGLSPPLPEGQKFSTKMGCGVENWRHSQKKAAKRIPEGGLPPLTGEPLYITMKCKSGKLGQRTVPRAGASEMGWPVQIPRRRGGKALWSAGRQWPAVSPRYGGRVCTSGTNSGGTTDRLIRPEPFPARGVFIYSVRGRERAEAWIKKAKEDSTIQK